MKRDRQLPGPVNRRLCGGSTGAKGFFGIERAAAIKLVQLEAAASLGELARPGNRLERLHGDRAGQWSIRINDKWRVCFEWPRDSPGPVHVEIVDYH